VHPPTNWTEVSAIAACIGVTITSIGVIVALIFHIKNLSHARLSNSAKMVFDLVDLFDSTEWLGYRRHFAKRLLEDRDNIDVSGDAPVLEFFEDLGYMTRRRILDKGMVWHSFSWLIERYYRAVTKQPNLIEKGRAETNSRTLYRELIWLQKELSVLSAKEEELSVYVPPSEEDIKRFLENETKLTTD